MKADSLHMVKVFSSGGDIHYVLPHFQREYAWEKEEWQTLLKDVFSVYEIYDEKQPPEHFMGSLVVINDGTRAGTVPVFRLVDGQQRLTTISLLLRALEETLDESGEYANLKRKIHKMLVNQDESGDLYFKLLPTTKYGDRVSYCAIIQGKTPPENVDSNIPEAYEYLLSQLQNRFKSDHIDPNRLFNVLMNSLQAVFINLDHNERPYEIFESLNYKGRSLTQADLVRNYIAMKLPADRQEPVFNELWSPIEQLLLEKRQVGRSRLGELTAFLRHYFAYLSGVLVNKEHVYSRFRDRGQSMTVEEFEAELAILKRFAGYYDRLLRPKNEPDYEIRRQLERLDILESATAYPFLLFMYDEWLYQQRITRESFLIGLYIIEAYMVRRFLNRDPSNYLNRMFPTLAKEVDVTNFVESLRKALGSKNEPSNVRLRQAAEMVSIYKRDSFTRRKLALVFDAVNRSLSRGSGAYTVLSDDPTIEHIMPQTLTDEWKRDLGPNWQLDFELLHTLGNLTVVTQDWNSQLSNASYNIKREKLSQHGLLLNQVYFGEIAPNVWNGDAIRERAQWLMAKITEIWPQLGEREAGQEEKPKAVSILGEVYTVNSWRDVLRKTADIATILSDDFEKQLAEEFPTRFKQAAPKNPGHSWHLLSNGWWIYVNLNANEIKSFSQRIVEAAGIPEDEYEVEFW